MEYERKSLPSWERGLKCHLLKIDSVFPAVAPFVGAWIEIAITALIMNFHVVAPFVGAWFEISLDCRQILRRTVAPFVGAWIEIHPALRSPHPGFRRSLRGSVD